MNSNETSVNGTDSTFYNAEQVEQPGTSSYNNSIESSVPSFSEPFFNAVEFEELINNLLRRGEWDELALHESPQNFSDDDSNVWDDICPSMAGAEREQGSSPPLVSPVSTYSCPSTPDDAEALNTMEGAKSAMDNDGGNCINVSNPENSVLPAALSKPGCSWTCTGCHDAHGLTPSEAQIRRHKFFKGVNKKKGSDKWTCEIRVSKNFLQDSNLNPKSKLWIGTFDTQCQAARALHVGRFLLSEKKKKNTTADANPELDSETIRALSKFKDSMRGKPLDNELLCEVKKLATEYGKTGSL